MKPEKIHPSAHTLQARTQPPLTVGTQVTIRNTEGVYTIDAIYHGLYSLADTVGLYPRTSLTAYDKTER